MPSQHLLRSTDLPQWMKTEPYIQAGYRRPLNSFRACFWSLLYSHNELVNTWSHLLPGGFFLALLLMTDNALCFGGTEILWADKLVFRIFIAGTAGCLLLSVRASAFND